jgi:hypothetical protein
VPIETIERDRCQELSPGSSLSHSGPWLWYRAEMELALASLVNETLAGGAAIGAPSRSGRAQAKFSELQETLRRGAPAARLDRDDFSSNRRPDLSSCLSMIFSENRYPLFRIML